MGEKRRRRRPCTKVEKNTTTRTTKKMSTATGMKNLTRALPKRVLAATPPPPPPPVKKSISFGDAMAFSGAGPETINGRLAMLGFISALGAEAASGESIFQQVGDAEPSILFAFVMFAAASLIPIFKGVKKEKFAIFSPEAEMLNGRAAMIGFALLIAIEAKSGAAFF